MTQAAHKTPPASFAEVLKTHRGKTKMRVEDLAWNSGVSYGSVTKYETGKQPGRAQVRKMADTLGLKGRARGVFFLAAGYSPDGFSIVVDESVIFDDSDGDEEAPIIHGLLSAA